MAHVVFPDHLLQFTGGERELELAVATVRELLLALNERYPEGEREFGRAAIAIDGQIHQDAYLEPLAAQSEVFFMQRIEGG